MGANGNRTGGGYVVGPNNQLLSDGTYWYEYDPEGNRTLRYVWTDGDSDGVVDSGERSQITEYEWDHRNRLVAVIERDTDGGPAAQVVEHTYDYLNRWVGRSVDTDGDGPLGFDDTYFVYDGTPGAVSLDRAGVTTDNIGQIVLQFDDDAQGAPQLTHRYLWGPAVDQILADEEVTSLATPGDVLWPLPDHLGTVRDLAEYDDSTGVTTVANHRTYDAFGRLVSETNAAIDHLFAFTGRALDESTALQNNLNRWYDAQTGRWLSQDPIAFNGGDANLHRYVGNQPTHGIDPSGLAWNWRNWWEAEKAFAYSFYVSGPINLGKGAWTFVRETGYYFRDVGAVGVDAAFTACGHPLRFEEWSQIGKSNQPSDRNFWWNAWCNAGRSGLAGGTLGISEMLAATWDYFRTGAADAYQQRMGSIAGAQLTFAGIIKATQVLMGRLTGGRTAPAQPAEDLLSLPDDICGPVQEDPFLGQLDTILGELETQSWLECWQDAGYPEGPMYWRHSPPNPPAPPGYPPPPPSPN